MWKDERCKCRIVVRLSRVESEAKAEGAAAAANDRVSRRVQAMEARRV